MCRPLLFIILTLSGLHAEVSSLQTPLSEGQMTQISCEYNEPKEKASALQGLKPAIGTWHYRVFIPEGYAADPSRRYPCLFVTHASGNAELWGFESWIKKHRWLAVMLVESKNGPWEPIMGNFLAAHDDAVKRLRIQDGWKVATGMSGGARASSWFAILRPGFRGVFLQGAGVASGGTAPRGHILEAYDRQPDLGVFMTVGDQDSNRGEVELLQKLKPARLPFEVAVFSGGHVKAPQNLAEQGMDWLTDHLWARAKGDMTQKDFVAGQAEILAAALSSAPTEMERYRQIQRLIGWVRDFSLSAHPKLKPLLPELSATFATLKKDPAIAREIAAEAAWLPVDQARRRAMERLAEEKVAAKRESAVQRLASELRAFATKHPTTEAAARAEKWASELK
jgi:hypothetical protein